MGRGVRTSVSRIETLAEGITLYLGDCREITEELPRQDILLTDPPYGMEFVSNHRAEKYANIRNDDRPWPLEFATKLPVLYAAYIFCRWNELRSVKKPTSVVTWVKNNWSMGDLEHEHARQTELILFYPGPRHGFANGRPTDVVECSRTGNRFHPTEKPVDLLTAILRWTTGVTVIDPFMGSGTTGVAAVKLGRKFIGIEIELKYFDTACRRISEVLKQPDMFIEQPIRTVEQQLAWDEMWERSFDQPELL
jgi:DNA modification methylase